MTKDNNNKLVKSAQTSKNTFVNIPTEFEFTKGVDGENENTDEIIKKISSIQLKKLRFNIYTTIDNIEYKVYVIKNSDGIYEYARLVRIDNGAIKMKRIDSADATSSIQLDDDKNFKIKYLPKGDYYIKEEGASINNNGTCDCDDNDCIPFYFPKGNVGTFRITYCSSVTAASSTTCKGYKDQTIVGTATSSYDNKLTVLKFTKKDFYSYGDANDVNGSAVSFEDTKERSDFDRIVFNVKDSQGNVLRFIKVGNNITDSNKKCLNDNDYSVYRYVPNEVYDTLTEEEKARVVTDLHTCGGHIRILGLCRGKTYKVEEVSVDRTLLNASFSVYRVIHSAEASSNMSNLTGIVFGPRGEGDNYVSMMKDHRTKGFSPLIKRRFIIGSYVLQKENQERYFKNAQRVRRLIVDTWKDLYKKYDAVICPVGIGPAKKFEDLDKPLDINTMTLDEHLQVGNFGGFPSITIPNGFVSGVPVGVNITGNCYDDEKVLNIAYALESAMDYKNQIAKEVKHD